MLVTFENTLRECYPGIPLLESPRRFIFPLPLPFFELFFKSIAHLEKALGLIPSGEILEEHTQQAMQTLYSQAICQQDIFWWYTNWQTILKCCQVVIGSACFMGAPDETGMIELGYGINKPFRKKGTGQRD